MYLDKELAHEDPRAPLMNIQDSPKRRKRSQQPKQRNTLEERELGGEAGGKSLLLSLNTLTLGKCKEEGEPADEEEKIIKRHISLFEQTRYFQEQKELQKTDDLYKNNDKLNDLIKVINGARFKCVSLNSYYLNLLLL